MKLMGKRLKELKRLPRFTREKDKLMFDKNEYQKEYNIKNKNKRKENQREYYINNRDKILESKKNK